MPKKVAVTLPDGRVVAVDEDQVEALGLQREGATEGFIRAREVGQAEHYSGARQAFIAGLEGLASTATLGVSDIILDDNATRERANRQSTARTIGAVAGAVLPWGPGALGKLGALTPAGMAARAGTGLAEKLGIAGTTRGLAVAGGVEGALQGIGGEVARAELSGDPLTIEGVVVAGGRSAFFGAAAGGAAGVVMRGVKAVRTARAAEESVAEARVLRQRASETMKAADDAFAPVRSEVKAAREYLATEANPKPFIDEVRASAAQADDYMRNVGFKGATRGASPDVPTIKTPGSDPGHLVPAGRSGGLPATAADVVEDQVLTIPARQLKDRGFEQLDAGFSGTGARADKARAAMKAGQKEPIDVTIDPNGVVDITNGRHRLAAAIEADAPIAVRVRKGVSKDPGHIIAPRPDPGHIIAPGPARPAQIVDDATLAAWKQAERRALDAYTEVERALRSKDTTRILAAHQAHVAAVNDATSIAGFPANAMPTSRLDPAVAKEAIRGLKMFPSSAQQLAGMRPDTFAESYNALRTAPAPSAARAVEELNKVGQTLGTKLRPGSEAADLHAHLNAVRTQARHVVATLPGEEGGGRSGGFVQSTVRRGVMQAVKPLVGYALAGPIGALVAASGSGARTWVSNRVKDLLLHAGEPVARVIKRMGPVIERLRETYTGKHDDEKEPKKLLENRVKEIRRAGQMSRDLGFQAAQPFIQDHPDFALGLANHLATSAEYLANSLPVDPGSAMYMGQSDWEMSEGQHEELATRWEAVFHPLDALERIMNGDVDPVAAEALWATHPAIMQEGQMELVMNIGELRDADLPFSTVAGLSAAFQVPLDGLMLPENVAYLQTLSYAPQGQAPTGSESGGAPSTGGRPPAVGTSNTGNAQGRTRVQQLTA